MMPRGRWLLAIGTALLGAAAAAWALATRRSPTTYPYAFRFSLDLPRPLLGRDALLALLAPRPGEQLLEIGPGTGYYTLAVARALDPDGRLDILDRQQGMLDETMRRAGAAGITSITPTRGDAQSLPYPDAHFDAAYLVATLGEVPDKDAALCELRRVLKPGGRLVVGEGQPDPHMVRAADLQELTTAAGFRSDRQEGGRLGYLARFVNA